ncbi:MAG: hypothetical protein KF749_11240 [Bacteroidetes bacterium]|nr:hypothetical protein [Bacteroidota bacterium]MCW5896098.1 hypothetical protein [Bacteroidota bacterium]
MVRPIFKSPVLLAAVCVTILNVLLIWAFRFLPLYDYPIWLYEVHLMRELSQPRFALFYEMVSAPVPNLGLVGIVWALSFFVPLEAAGKIFLTLCVVGLPWAFRYCVRKIADNVDTPVAYFGFPFSFNIFFFGGQAFLFGFIVLLLVIGCSFPKLHAMKLKDWTILSFLLLVLYFIHAIAFVLAVGAFVGALAASGSKPRNVGAFVLALVPALICMTWYYASTTGTAGGELHWSFWGVAQSVLKSPLLFIKSFGISTPLPLTLLNGLWALALLILVSAAVIRARTGKMFDKRFALAIIIAFLLMLLLPDVLFAVYRPGTRFGFALIFLILLSISRIQLTKHWRIVAITVTAGVLLFNIVHFSSVNRQMEELYGDLQATMKSDTTFCVVRFDWPPERHIRDVAAASIDPLFGGIYYHQLDRKGVGWIFGTALLRLRSNHENLRPVLLGESPEEHASTFLESQRKSKTFGHLLLVGSSRIAFGLADALSKEGYVIAVQKENWTILRSSDVTD